MGCNPVLWAIFSILLTTGRVFVYIRLPSFEPAFVPHDGSHFLTDTRSLPFSILLRRVSIPVLS
jgi:hypothetical protein